MAKRESETISQQRKARQDFLELKKMQNGEMYAGPKPSEIDTTPKTFKDKFANFWFHYKFAAIAVLLSAVFLAVTVTQCLGKTKYDLIAVVFTDEYISAEYNLYIEKYFENYFDDINGDGQVKIQITNCSYDGENQYSEMSKTANQKFQTAITAEKSAFIFILNDGTKQKLKDIGKDFFEEENVILGKSFYDDVDKLEGFKLPENLSLLIKNVSKSKLEKDKDLKEYYKQAKKILKGVRADNIENNTQSEQANS